MHSSLTTHANTPECWLSDSGHVNAAFHAYHSPDAQLAAPAFAHGLSMPVHSLCRQVAHSLGRKVYVSKDKLAVLDCINLAPSYRALLTTNHLETNLHAVCTVKQATCTRLYLP
jgi:hypothetical protein